jgi:hypothetical protein
MKNLQTLLMVAAIAVMTTVQSFAQVDLFGAPRTISLAPPANLLGVATQNAFTNGPVDTRSYDGIAKIDFWACTNGSGTVTMLCETSPDQTNWTALTYALGVATTVIYTNSYYGSTNLTATDYYVLPGTITTPTSATAGWATTYLVSSPFTNVAAVTITANGLHEIGYNIADAGRYIHVIWTATGAATNGATSVGAVLTGRRASEVK